MATNTKTCGTCKFMWPLQKGKRGGDTVSLSRGHCLKRSIFPANRPGKHVYPPGAIVKDTPNAVIVPFIVREDQVVEYCTSYKEKA